MQRGLHRAVGTVADKRGDRGQENHPAAVALKRRLERSDEEHRGEHVWLERGLPVWTQLR
jgi:hypothetical protein